MIKFSDLENFTIKPLPSVTGKTLADVPGKLPRVMLNVDLSSSNYGKDKNKKVVLDPNEATLITSQIFNSKDHAPVLDLDIPHAYVQSTTEGHGHLYLDVALDWEKYVKLLTVLAECGIIETGYANASIAKGYSAARPPWVKKPKYGSDGHLIGDPLTEEEIAEKGTPPPMLPT